MELRSTIQRGEIRDKKKQRTEDEKINWTIHLKG